MSPNSLIPAGFRCGSTGAAFFLSGLAHRRRRLVPFTISLIRLYRDRSSTCIGVAGTPSTCTIERNPNSLQLSLDQQLDTVPARFLNLLRNPTDLNGHFHA
jgi:hypothetical protein